MLVVRACGRLAADLIVYSPTELLAVMAYVLVGGYLASASAKFHPPAIDPFTMLTLGG
jgi:hypothetical protein